MADARRALRARHSSVVVEETVRRELEALLRYAKAVGAAAAQEPESAGIVDGGRGYIGGALTTLHNLELVTDAEHQQWWGRLMSELPPTDWIGG